MSMKHTNIYMENFENILAPGKQPDMTKEYKPLIPHQMHRYLNPKQLKQHVLKSENIRFLITYYAAKLNCPERVIEQKIKNILNEIGLDRNLAIIRWCGIAITCIGQRICSGIYVNKKSMDEVKKCLGKNPVLYLPSHRSYMDFILMSYICFHYDLEIPGIAAGMDFLSMFAMGTMLRKTGAFFIRRSFSDDVLYWDVFREYMSALVVAYHIGVEFFIEGTRSRNFKSLLPKIGLLSMALWPYFINEISDITIVPIGVSYERLLEEQLFVYELLGVPKPKESTKRFFKALKIIDERFGKMYLDFGKPISVKEFFGPMHAQNIRLQRASLGAKLQKLTKYEVELVKKLANEVICQQQKHVVLNTFNLLSLYYASQLYNKRKVDLNGLAKGIMMLIELFEQLDAHISTNVNGIKPEILETIEIHANIVYFKEHFLELTQIPAEHFAREIDSKKLKAHALSPQTMAIAVPSLSLQLYINPCLFWLAQPAYLILAALQVESEEKYNKTNDISDNLTNNGVADLFERIITHATILENTFKYEFIINSNDGNKEDFHRNLNLLKNLGVLEISLQNGFHVHVYLTNDCTRVFLSSLAPFLLIYYQLAVVLNQKFSKENQTFSGKEILISVQQHIENLLQASQQKNVHPYCLALDNLNIALNALVQESFLIKHKSSELYERSTQKCLRQFEQQLLQYCNLMPFTQYYIVNERLANCKL